MRNKGLTLGTVTDDMATGNYKGVCFDYFINNNELYIVDPLGKYQTNQDHPLRSEMHKHLKSYFSHEEVREHLHNVARHNN